MFNFNPAEIIGLDVDEEEFIPLINFMIRHQNSTKTVLASINRVKELESLIENQPHIVFTQPLINMSIQEIHPWTAVKNKYWRDFESIRIIK